MKRPAPPSANSRLSNALGGFTTGIDTSAEAMALAALCFAGPLAIGQGLAASAFLLASALAAFLVARSSQVGGAIATVQDTSIAVLALACAQAATIAHETAGPMAGVLAAFCVIGLSTLMTGCVMVGLGRYRLARLARYLPFSVASGFLASSGAVLIMAASFMALGLDLTASWTVLYQEFDFNRVFLVLLPALLLALALRLALSRYESALAFIGVLLLGVALFWGLQGLLQSPLSNLISTGQLPHISPLQDETGLHDIFQMQSFTALPLALWAALPSIAAAILLNIISLILNLSGIEVDSAKQIDYDEETLIAGRVNLIVGWIGSPAAFTDSPSTILVNKMGLFRKEAGYGYAFAALLGAGLIGLVLPWVPVFVSSGLLIFVGLDLLNDWLWQVRRQIDRLEWLVILVVVAAALGFGFIAAMGLGLVLSAISFALAYAKTPFIRKSWSRLERRSLWDRSVAAEAYLSHNGGAIKGMSLQGHIYFARVDSLGQELQNLVWPDQEAKYLILDFSHVSGFDGAACSAFERILNKLLGQGVNIGLAALNPASLAALNRWNPALFEEEGIRLFTDTEAALEKAEAALLARAPLEVEAEEQAYVPQELAVLAQPQSLRPNDRLITAGDCSQDFWLLKSGRLGVYTSDGRKLRSLAAGALVGELSMLSQGLRSADVRAESPCALLHFPADKIAALIQSDPATAVLLYRWLAAGVSQKLIQANSRSQD